MCAGSKVGAVVSLSGVPVIDGVADLIHQGMVAGGTQRNHAFVSDSVAWGTLALDEQYLLADAQTSGGLLLAVAPERADALVAALQQRNTLAAAIIGHTTADHPGHIALTK